MSSNNSANQKDQNENSVPYNGKDSEKFQNDTTDTKKDDTSLKEHPNKLVQFFAKAGYTVWIIVMATGMILAFLVSLFLL